MKVHLPQTPGSNIPQSGGSTKLTDLFSRNRLLSFALVLSLHVAMLLFLISYVPLRTSIVRLMPTSMLTLPMTKITLTPPPLPVTNAVLNKATPSTSTSASKTAPMPQTNSPLARVDDLQRSNTVVPLERDFPANPLPVLAVPNPVTEQREELGKTLGIPGGDGEKIEAPRIGEMDNNVILITKLGASKAEYIAPNFLLPQLEQAHFQVEVGDFEDIETALVNQIILQIRTRYKKEIYWNSKIKARMIRLSMLPQDQAELEKFLKMEIFGKKKVRDYSYWDKSKF